MTDREAQLREAQLREAQLRRAATLPDRRKLLAIGNYRDACAQNWLSEKEALEQFGSRVEDSEVPVLDPVMQAPIEKTDLVVLSDRNCYAKSSVQGIVDRAVTTLAGRHKLPLSGQEMTDDDYAAVDRAVLTGRALERAAWERMDVQMGSFVTATPEQRLEELLRRYEMWKQTGRANANEDFGHVVDLSDTSAIDNLLAKVQRPERLIEILVERLVDGRPSMQQFEEFWNRLPNDHYRWIALSFATFYGLEGPIRDAYRRNLKRFVDHLIGDWLDGKRPAPQMPLSYSPVLDNPSDLFSNTGQTYTAPFYRLVTHELLKTKPKHAFPFLYNFSVVMQGNVPGFLRDDDHVREIRRLLQQVLAKWSDKDIEAWILGNNQGLLQMMWDVSSPYGKIIFDALAQRYASNPARFEALRKKISERIASLTTEDNILQAGFDPDEKKREKLLRLWRPSGQQ